MAEATPVRIRDIADSTHGLVGYDDRLTRDRSPVRFWLGVLFVVKGHISTRGLVGYDDRLTRDRSPVRLRAGVSNCG